MTNTTPRERADAAISDLTGIGGCIRPLCTLMSAKLEEARDAMENAGGGHEFFRAQGRAHLAREILDVFTRESANQ